MIKKYFEHRVSSVANKNRKSRIMTSDIRLTSPFSKLNSTQASNQASNTGLPHVTVSCYHSITDLGNAQQLAPPQVGT